MFDDSIRGDLEYLRKFADGELELISRSLEGTPRSWAQACADGLAIS